MNIRKVMKKTGKRSFDKELEKASDQASGQPETLEMCVNEFMDKAPESLVGIKVHGKGKQLILGTLTVRGLHSVIDDIPASIRDEYGGGGFCLEFFGGPNKKVLATYYLDIAGAIKQHGVKAEDNGDSIRTVSRSFQQDLMAMFQAQLAAAQAQNTALIGMLTQGGDSSKFEEFAMQFMANSMDNRLTREEHALDSATGILSLMNEMRPQIPPEDGNVALINAAATALPGLIQLFMSRNSQSQVPALMSGQSIPNMKSLPPGLEVLAGAAPESIAKVLQSLSPEQRAQLGTKTIDPDTTSDTVELPGPGEQQPVEAGPSGVQPQHTPQMPVEHEIFDIKIRQLRAAAKNEAEPRILADKIIAIVEASRLLTPDNPHPLLKELTQAEDAVQLQTAMMGFFHKIPEFADSELQRKIGLAIYAILAGEEIAEDEAGDNSELLSTTPGVRAGTDDTADAAEIAPTEQDKHGGIDEREPGGNDSEGFDKPGPAPDGEDVQIKVA